MMFDGFLYLVSFLMNLFKKIRRLTYWRSWWSTGARRALKDCVAALPLLVLGSFIRRWWNTSVLSPMLTRRRVKFHHSPFVLAAPVGDEKQKAFTFINVLFHNKIMHLGVELKCKPISSWFLQELTQKSYSYTWNLIFMQWNTPVWALDKPL